VYPGFFWLPVGLGFLSTSLLTVFGGIFGEFFPGIFVYHLVMDFFGVFGLWEFLGFLVYTWLLN
jgi:hypothetical protein